MIKKNTEHGYYTTDELGILHSFNDEPAVYPEEHLNDFGETIPGCQVWYKEGIMHRDNDQPAVIMTNGLKVWYENGFDLRRENE